MAVANISAHCTTIHYCTVHPQLNTHYNILHAHLSGAVGEEGAEVLTLFGM